MLSSDHEIKKPNRLNIHVDISKKEHHHPANYEQGVQQPADVPKQLKHRVVHPLIRLALLEDPKIKY